MILPHTCNVFIFLPKELSKDGLILRQEGGRDKEVRKREVFYDGRR